MGTGCAAGMGIVGGTGGVGTCGVGNEAVIGGSEAFGVGCDKVACGGAGGAEEAACAEIVVVANREDRAPRVSSSPMSTSMGSDGTGVTSRSTFLFLSS